MKNLFTVIFLSIFTLVGCLPSDRSNSDSYKVERVIDGDTFIANDTRIRLWGIDAPEKNEPIADKSTSRLKSLLSQGNVTCVFKHKDRYERDVMQCFAGDIDVASDMVKLGLATDYKRYSKGYYETEEGIAKKQKIGIWR